MSKRFAPLALLLLLTTPGAIHAAALRPATSAQPPVLVLDDSAGQRHDLRDYRGKVVLVNFWASYCGPCIMEMPSMLRLAARLKDRPFAILAVNAGESPATVTAFRRRLAQPVGFPLLLDPLGEATEQWQVQGIPTSFLIDKAGKLRYRVSGGVDWGSPEVITTINKLLN